MPTLHKAYGERPYPNGIADPQRLDSVPKHLRSRLMKSWRGGERRLRFVVSGDGARWLPMRLWFHIALYIGVAVALLFGLLAVFKGLFSPSLDDPLKIEVIRLSLFIIAGVGGVFALVIAYRRQGLNEAAEVRTERAEAREDGKVFNERFKSAAEQLSSERAANRLAGVYAMAGLADDWDQGRQTCINVLCAYLRMPYEPPSPTAPTEAADGRDFADDRKEDKQRRQEQQVRHTIINVIGERLRAEVIWGKTWHGHDFDFSEAHFDGGNLSEIKMTGGSMEFRGAVFSAGNVDFTAAEFLGGWINFFKAKFTGGRVDFTRAWFTESLIHFNNARFTGGQVDFLRARFAGSEDHVDWADFAGSTIQFAEAEFSGGRVDFHQADFINCQVDLVRAEFIGGQVDFSSVAAWDSPPTFGSSAQSAAPRLLLPIFDVDAEAFGGQDSR